MSTTTKNNFRFWFPIDEIRKGKDKAGKDVMIVGGIASTKTRDTDGEILDPNGFDISYLKDRGIINWNHSKSPEAVIGEPTLAEVRKEGLYIESMLYPDSKVAKSVYNLIKTLGKNSKTRKVGYSVEGKATERLANDETNVTKAMITGAALTISPKNPDSIVDIIKGEFNGWDDTELPPTLDEVDFEKGEIIEASTTGGEQYIIDITREDGNRVTVDKDYNVKVIKALTANSSSGQAVTHSHVDGETKNQMNGNLKKIVEKSNDNEDSDELGLTKEQVITKILKSNSVISFEKANEIFNTLNKLTMATKKTEITEDLLQKSLDQLGLSDKSEIIEKGKKGKVEPEEEVDFDDEDKINDGKKANVKKGDDEDDDDEVEKSAPKKKIKKAVEPVIEKSESGSIDEVKEMLKSIAIIAKGSYDIAKSNQDEISTLKEKFEEFGNEAPVGRKSIAKSVQRDFQKSTGDDLNKANGAASQSSVPVLSAVKHKPQILNMLDHLAFNKGGFNKSFADAMTLFEASGTMNQNIQKGIENEFKVTLVQ
jgi:hypothetical protein